MTVRFDHREVDAYAITLDMAAGDIMPEVSKVVAKGALNIKNDARQRARFVSSAKFYRQTITYDTRQLKSTSIAEIGPDQSIGGSQAALGNLLEHGTPTSPPKPHFGPAGDAEEPKFQRAMEDLAARLLERR